MSAWVHGRGGLRTVCYGAVKDVFFSEKTGVYCCDSSQGEPATNLLYQLNTKCLGLAPVVAGLGLVGEHLIEGFGLLDENVALQPGLMQQHGLQAHQFQHR
jgi:hypothetical protein